MIGLVISLVGSLLLDVHTYVGIVIGAALGWAGLKRFYETAEKAVTDVASKV